MRNNNGGFTLIELLVVVLIIGILAAMAMPQYFKALERSRMTEAVTLLANTAQAQQRKYMQINKYTKNFSALDVAPKNAEGSAWCTKGGTEATAAGCNNGFLMSLDTTEDHLKKFEDAQATAQRTAGGGTLQYDYTLSRYYAGNNTTCTANNKLGGELCADFCGIDSVDNGKSCCSDGGDDECTAPTGND